MAPVAGLRNAPAELTLAYPQPRAPSGDGESDGRRSLSFFLDRMEARTAVRIATRLVRSRCGPDAQLAEGSYSAVAGLDDQGIDGDGILALRAQQKRIDVELQQAVLVRLRIACDGEDRRDGRGDIGARPTAEPIEQGEALQPAHRRLDLAGGDGQQQADAVAQQLDEN